MEVVILESMDVSLIHYSLLTLVGHSQKHGLMRK